MVAILAIAGIAAIVIGVVVYLLNGFIVQNQNTTADTNAALEERFGHGDYFVRLPDGECFGLAWSAEAVVIGDSASEAEAIGFSDIRAANVEIDGINVTTSKNTTHTNRGSQLVGGAVGAAALGPLGLMIGGLSGSTTSTGRAVEQKKIKSVKMVLRVADRVQPIRSFVFFHTHGEGFDADIVKPFLGKAAHFHALLMNMMEDRDAVMPLAAQPSGIALNAEA